MNLVKKDEKYNISIIETMVKKNGVSVYAGYCRPFWHDLPPVEFNFYVDEANKVIHLYDPFQNNTTSVINLLNESFIKGICDKMKLKAKRYEIYTYMPPINEHTAHITAYNPNDNEFYKWDKEKCFAYFIEVAERNGQLI